MPNVTTHYRVVVVAGRHRQPRSTTTWFEPNPAGHAVAVTGTTFAPPFQPFLGYDEGGTHKDATFPFWSATDGTNGQTSTDHAFAPTVGANDMTITAWYLPPGGIGSNGGPGYVVDAFSDAHGDFVDDTFVTVKDGDGTVDAALTTEANVVGILDTPNFERLDSVGSISDGEGFERWITSAGQGQTQPVVVGLEDTLAAGTSGVAIATFHHSDVTVPKVNQPQEGLVILGGIAVDGNGYAYPIGHPGSGGPVGPWGPFVARAARAALMGSLAQGIRGSAEVAHIAVNEIQAATKQLGSELEG